MKYRSIFFLIVILPLLYHAEASTGSEGLTEEAFIADLLTQMTLEEKIGQMTQLTLDVVADSARTKDDIVKIDAVKLRRAIVDYHIGSLFNISVTGSALSLENWQEIITQIQDMALKETRLRIPIIYGIDAIHGANYLKNATIFPHSLGMAATWNPELVRKSAAITAAEIRACGIPWNFNPVLGVGRQPLWARLYETYGEDPYLVSVMGAAYVKGLQGTGTRIAPDKAAACIKHFVGYSVPHTGKDRTPALIPERTLWEYFIPSFKAAIDAGAGSVMINSSEINGIAVHASHYYLTELLVNRLGFKGFTVTDWEDIKNLHTRARVATSEKEAVRMAVLAGVDMSMVPFDFSFYNHLLELVREGKVPERRIDEAAERILRFKYKLGLFENPYPNKKLAQRIAGSESQRICLQAARESITLLKNKDSILPVSKNKRILVTGPTANRLTSLNGGWTITWQGDRESLYPKNKLNILQALEQKFGVENVRFVQGTDLRKEVNIAQAVAAAQNADLIIACLGEGAYCELMGNINDLTIPEAQQRLVEALDATGKPLILVLTQGRPRIINKIADKAEGIIMAYYPGMEGGLAIADVIAGDFNPCGKLPITYPRYSGDLTLYDYKYCENENDFKKYNPQFPFGFGLSYTDFEYSHLSVSQDTIHSGDTIRISITVKNIGSRAGKEVVQLYLSDLYASITPPNKRLKRFRSVTLQPGESKSVEFTLREKDLSFIGHANRPVVENGKFKIMLGDLSKEFVYHNP